MEHVTRAQGIDHLDPAGREVMESGPVDPVEPGRAAGDADKVAGVAASHAETGADVGLAGELRERWTGKDNVRREPDQIVGAAVGSKIGIENRWDTTSPRLAEKQFGPLRPAGVGEDGVGIVKVGKWQPLWVRVQCRIIEGDDDPFAGIFG